jgi:hypothetical protein
MLVLLIGDIYEERHWDGFMMPDTGVQALLLFYLRNLRGCNYDITHEIDLW